jgi:GT2 family glycosyltransferase
MDVSVIIITRNTRDLTSDAIRSVQTPENVVSREIIVVDNGSNDDTAEFLKQNFPQVKVVRSEINLGFARGCNLAAKSAQGEFLLLLNSDARLEPDALPRAVEYMRANADCAVAGAQLLNPDGSRQNSIANFPTLATELLNKSLLRRLFPRRFPGKEQMLDSPTTVETVVGAFMLIRKSAWDTLGGLDECFFFFFEETHFCFQVRRRGWNVFHLPAVRVWHGQGQTAKQVSACARIEYWRSRYVYFSKNHSLFTRTILAAGLWLRLTADFLVAGLLALVTFGQNTRWRGRWKVCFALVFWHLRGCPPETGLPRS